MGFKAMPERGVEVGYYAIINSAWVGVIEYRLGLTGPYAPEWNLLIPQQFLSIPHTDVTYGLTLTRNADATEIALSMWDRTPARNLLFRQTVEDQPRVGGGTLDNPFRAFSGLFVGMSPLSNPAFPLTAEVDNLYFERSSKPRLGIRNKGNGSVEVWYPSSPDERYRLYRSLDDLEHFFLFSDILQGTGDPLTFTDALAPSQHAFYKYTQPPASESPGVLSAYAQRFLQMVVNQHNPSRLPTVCGKDVCYDDVAALNPRNADEMQEDLGALFEAFPDYRLTSDAVLTADSLAVVESVVSGTHEGDWLSGPLGLLPATGEAVSFPQLMVLDFEADLIVRCRLYQDMMMPMIQLGILPAPEIPALVPSMEPPPPAPNSLGPSEVIAQNAALWNAADLPAYMATYSEDADLVTPGFPPGLSRAEYAAVQEGYWTAFPDHDMQIIRQVDLGDGWVLTEALWEGTNTGPYFGTPATNERVALRGAILSQVDEAGLITTFHIYFDNLTMLGQLGLLTPPE
jgi:steroid delta-isomerase-like uncharacterized protein